MKITVEMDIAEFAEFQKYLQGKSQARIANKRTELLAKKVIYALGIDEKGKKKVKIIDHEHAAELLEMANDIKELFGPAATQDKACSLE